MMPVKSCANYHQARGRWSHDLVMHRIAGNPARLDGSGRTNTPGDRIPGLQPPPSCRLHLQQHVIMLTRLLSNKLAWQPVQCTCAERGHNTLSRIEAAPRAVLFPADDQGASGRVCACPCRALPPTPGAHCHTAAPARCRCARSRRCGAIYNEQIR